MVPELRTRHRRIWYAWAILLPLAFLVAVASIPETAIQSGVDPGQPGALPVVVNSVATDEFTATLRTGDPSSEPSFQLELLIHKPLTSAATLVYVTGQKEQAVENRLLLGILSSGQVHRFALDGLPGAGSPLYVTLYDPIKKQTLQTIKF